MQNKNIPWCENCFLQRFYKIINNMIEREDRPIVSGIGCTGRITSMIQSNNLHIHTLHGRAVPIASGISHYKNPIVISGDGDLLDIGLSHLVHAKSRNDNIKVICLHNGVYAMTGRQKVSLKTNTIKDIIDIELHYNDQDISSKLNKFISKDGFSLMIIHFPCLRLKK